MFTQFEEYAAASMLGQADSPPRVDGKLLFTNRWERDVFGLALSLAKAGCFEWEDFRQCLIDAIGRWEALDCASQPRWDYYERFFEALLNVIEASGTLDAAELARALAPRAASQPVLTDLQSHEGDTHAPRH
ncbi:MAG TPA: nitrile hydratase accessory protein [Paraburkholderia sp.]|uniref:nitrile hydratase accessory protein n=1 Tax=Paraburkholderia sp. TaxID=1926495 RepID=UPI002CE77145|nr:nitrile hydratase accessory protein [Paraburkholderia sp.]HTR08821.1 nitrile hydratase accessory protein [Paraburkholderia sp.]